jgi:hypothetical protein
VGKKANRIFDGVLLPSLKAEPHQNVAAVVICISMSFYPPFHAFFLDTIQEIYNKGASLSIYLKKKFIYF